MLFSYFSYTLDGSSIFYCLHSYELTKKITECNSFLVWSFHFHGYCCNTQKLKEYSNGDNLKGKKNCRHVSKVLIYYLYSVDVMHESESKQEVLWILERNTISVIILRKPLCLNPKFSD